MTIRLPGIRAVFACMAAACAMGSALTAYFGAAWGGMAAFLSCALLLLWACALRPAKGEIIACGLSGAVFGAMHTIG